MRHVKLMCDLRKLECAATNAADPTRAPLELREAYEELRRQAEALNTLNEWATAEDFATQLPGLEDLALIDRLDREFSSPDPAAISSGDASIDRLIGAIGLISAWAAGLRMAYETLDHDVRE